MFSFQSHHRHYTLKLSSSQGSWLSAALTIKGTLSPVTIFFLLLPACLIWSIPPLWWPVKFNPLTNSAAKRKFCLQNLGNILRK